MEGHRMVCGCLCQHPAWTTTSSWKLGVDWDIPVICRSKFGVPIWKAKLFYIQYWYIYWGFNHLDIQTGTLGLDPLGTCPDTISSTFTSQISSHEDPVTTTTSALVCDLVGAQSCASALGCKTPAQK